MRIIRFCVALLCFILVLIVPARAQEKYPNRPVKFVVSFAAGGSNDIIARVLCDWLSDHLGQQFVVENRTGASGNVGAQSLINSAPDGYTVMFVGPNNAISQSVFKKLPFDFNRDTAPVAGIMTLINIMVVPPDLPVKTVAEFVAYAKANPGTINMASPGAGTSPHMSGELFKMMTGIQMQHVPYRGAGPGLSGPDDRQDAGVLRQPAGLSGVRENRQAEGARRHIGATLVRLPRCAVDRRDGARLRRQPLLRRLGPARHAA